MTFGVEQNEVLRGCQAIIRYAQSYSKQQDDMSCRRWAFLPVLVVDNCEGEKGLLQAAKTGRILRLDPRKRRSFYRTLNGY